MTAAPATESDVTVPLIVDLDGTLTLSDTFIENFVLSLSHAPLKTVLSLAQLRQDTSHIKQRIAGLATLDPASIPYRDDLQDFLKREKARGREIHLVTAADQSIATSVAAHAGYFTSAVGSTPGLNLKGVNKLAFLKEKFPKGFDYIGDSTADMPIWQETRVAHIAGNVPKMSLLAKAQNIAVGHTFANEGSSFRIWRKALRMHQWVKNALILVPWGLAGIFTAETLLKLVAIFLIFNIVASATYLINDLMDLRHDRAHPTKKLRPLARGTLSVQAALAFVIIAMPVSVLLIALLSLKAAGYVLCYVALTLLYSFTLKKIAFVDAVCLATLFTLRIVIGVAAIGVPISAWLLSFSGLFFLSLGLAKRHLEVMKAGKEADYTGASGRGYRTEDWPVTLSFGVASAMSAIIIMMLFIQEETQTTAKYASPGWLYLIAACLLLWVMRIWQFCHRRLLDDDPIVFALKDPGSLALGAVTGVAFLLSHLR